MEEYCATNAGIEVRVFLSQLYMMARSSTVRVIALYAKGYRFESGRANSRDDLAQLVEHYPDTVQVDSSSLSVITIAIWCKG